jgi:hypothetical protein
MGPIKLVLLRRHLKRQLQEDDLSPKERTAITKCLATPGALRATALHVAHSNENGKVGALGDGKLLTWLWDHRAEILAFVQEIMKIFGG